VKPVFAADLVDAGEAVQVVANIKHAEAVEGKWYAILFDAKGREVDAREGGDSSSFTASFSIDALEPGEYTIIVGFLGVVNGEEVDFDEELFFEVVEEDPQPQDPQDPNSPDQGDDGDKGVNIGDDGDDEDSSDKVDNAKGGPLPKTDTAYPVGAMAGAALLSAGLLYTRFRRQA
jgi:LPXTG-motif cell wall-anchored protein